VKEISEETGIADNAIRATLGRHRDRFIDLGGKRWGLTSLP
jgi:DNA-directed RNA polymerase delta subunit